MANLLRGVQFKGSHCATHSVVMRAKSGTVRFVEGRHSLNKKPNLFMQDINFNCLHRPGIYAGSILLYYD